MVAARMHHSLQLCCRTYYLSHGGMEQFYAKLRTIGVPSNGMVELVCFVHVSLFQVL